MCDFPEFMKKPENMVPVQQQNTPDIQGIIIRHQKDKSFKLRVLLLLPRQCCRIDLLN